MLRGVLPTRETPVSTISAVCHSWGFRLSSWATVNSIVVVFLLNDRWPATPARNPKTLRTENDRPL